MAGGKLKVAPLISHRFSIEKAATAYDVITGKKKETFLGVLLTYSETVEKLEDSKVVRFTAQTFNPSNNVKLGVLGAGLYANSTLLPVIKNDKDFD